MADKYLNSSGVAYLWQKIKTWVGGLTATNTDYGMVKTNPASGITLNGDGRLEVGGRLGETTDGGLYAPATIAPAKVNGGSLLVTEASGLSINSKSLAVVTGTGFTLKTSAPAGATTYTIANNYSNRIALAAYQTSGAVATLDENDAKAGNYSTVISVKMGGQAWTPADTGEGDIVITVDKTVNPTKAATSIRVYASAGSGFSDILVGQSVGTGGSGASVIVGQRAFSKSGNVCLVVAADTWNQGNGNAVFGRQHISMKNRSFLAGTGHNTTNARSESVAAVGQWSNIDGNTFFAVGNGTSERARANAFEIRQDGTATVAVLKSPNGTAWKISVANDGTLSASAA